MLDFSHKRPTLGPWFDHAGLFLDSKLADIDEFIATLGMLAISQGELDQALEQCGVGPGAVTGVLIYTNAEATPDASMPSWRSRSGYGPYFEEDSFAYATLHGWHFVGIDCAEFQDPIANFADADEAFSVTDASPVLAKQTAKLMVHEAVAAWRYRSLATSMLDEDIAIYTNLSIPGEIVGSRGMFEDRLTPRPAPSYGWPCPSRPYLITG